MIEGGIEIEKEQPNILERMEVKSVDYPSLFSAMGKERYNAFTYGEGLKSIPHLQEEFSKNGFTNGLYSIGTYRDKNNHEETSLFVSQNISGNRFVYEFDTETKKYFHFFDMYHIKHLYVVGEAGVTTDLTEELASGMEINMCPNKSFFQCGATPQKTIFLPDLDKFSEVFDGVDFGLPTILHEIGHLKHMQAGMDLFSQKNTRRLTTVLGALKVTRDDLEKKIKSKNRPFLKALTKYIDENMPEVIISEKVASSWACKWMDSKRDIGANYWTIPYQDYWEQLEVAFDTYTSYLLSTQEK